METSQQKADQVKETIEQLSSEGVYFNQGCNNADLGDVSYRLLTFFDMSSEEVPSFRLMNTKTFDKFGIQYTRHKDIKGSSGKLLK